MHIKNPILRLALPSVVSNITVPLLGLVDMTIVGHMGADSCIAAIAIGSTVFSMIYWVFAFLRMGTTGIVAQAYGAGDTAATQTALRRALTIGVGAGAALIAVQVPLLYVVRLIMRPEADVWPLAVAYCRACIWGAPGMLAGYALTGWYIGMHNTRRPMWMAIVQNVVNIVTSLLLVYVFHLGVTGVALGTVVGIYAGVGFGFVGVAPLAPQGGERAAWGRLFSVSRDIFLRTLCLVAVTVYFTSAGSQQGKTVVAANALLMQMFILFSYFTDGLANAAEALSGEAAGRGRRLGPLVRSLFRWGLGLSLAFSLLYIAGGGAFLSLLTDQRAVLAVAHTYLVWVYLIPLAGLMAFIWDGVFIGLTWTRGMLLSMAAAMVVFFATWFALAPALSNHALWLAFTLYLFTRGAVQSALALREF